jgi:hypothetical protein
LKKIRIWAAGLVRTSSLFCYDGTNPGACSTPSPFPGGGRRAAAPLQPLDPATLRGLPAPLPDGGHALWQDSPLWTALAQRSLMGV